ncbi:hypothetical protein ACT3UJ_02460 [Halomonas sp. 86]|uniref:hypothetical protein n=1 Tax=unclassified Halomonas TaxID=2609666 RepID=UPI004034AC25
MTTLNAHTFQSREDAEAHYLGLCDFWASEKRRVDPVQTAIHQRKAQEASAGGGPWLSAEAETLCVTEAELCERVKAAEAETEREWQVIEIKRVKAKADIRAAETASQMHIIYQQLRAI